MLPDAVLDAALKHNAKLHDRIDSLERALKAIAKGEVYLTHDTIEQAQEYWAKLATRYQNEARDALVWKTTD